MHQIVQPKIVNIQAKFKLPILDVNFHPTLEDLSPLDATLGQVWIGNPHKVICIPANSVKVVEGKTSRKAQ